MTDARARMGGLVARLDSLGYLREGLTVDRATDLVYALFSHETCLALTRDAQWITENYTAWLNGTLRGQNSDMNLQPVNLDDALASFEDIYSPRIVARINDYDVRIAHAKGEQVWHVHEDTDEFFLVLDGLFTVSLRSVDGVETTVELRQGDTLVVPKGTEHRPSSTGASILMFEPSGTLSTGDHAGDLPDNVDSTTGHSLP